MLSSAELEQAFAERLPVMAKVEGISASGEIIRFDCISAIKRRWSEKLNREVRELELLNRNSHSLVTVPIENVSLSADAEFKEDDIQLCVRTYEKYFGLLTTRVYENINFYLRNGMESKLIARIMEHVYEQGKRNWNYTAVVLMKNLTQNIKTLDAFECKEREWAEQAQKIGQAKSLSAKSKFNNYKDTNKPDYSNYSDQILKDMLGE